MTGRTSVPGAESPSHLGIPGQQDEEAERFNLEAQLQKVQKMEAIGQLAGGIAHDFNNILGSILGNAELLATELRDRQDALESVYEIFSAVRRGSDLVKQILLFSRRGGQNLQPLRIDGIVRDAIQIFRSALPVSIDIRSRITSELPQIVADATQIQQVLANLCTNAWHAMEEKGGVLCVELSVIEPSPEDRRRIPGLGEKPYVRLLVSDTGHGMAPEIQARVFEPFFTTKPQGKGTGLGLSVVHGIVADHQGFIHMSSQPERGSVFEIFFPALPQSEALVQHEEEEQGIPTGRGERILVVDDEPTFGRVLVRLLKVLSYEAEWQSNPLEALAAFRRDPERYQGILLDFSMPRMTGLELAEKVRNLPSPVPIVMMSGFSEPVDSEQMSKLNIKSLLQKPLSQETIAQALKEALRSSPYRPRPI